MTFGLPKDIPRVYPGGFTLGFTPPLPTYRFVFLRDATSTGSKSMPMTTPVLSVTASGASTVFVKRISIPMWTNAMLGSLPVLFMFGTLAICSETYGAVQKNKPIPRREGGFTKGIPRNSWGYPGDTLGRPKNI